MDLVRRNLAVTGLLILCSVIFAAWFGLSGAAASFISLFSGTPWLAALIAGVGFASLFTTAPATVALGTLSVDWSMWQTAVAGGIGALLGDLVILELMARLARRDSRRVAGIVGPPRFLVVHRIRQSLEKGPARILLWVTGAIIIASPLPDEAGLALMGLSKIPLIIFVPVSFLLNAAGIYVIGLVTAAA